MMNESHQLLISRERNGKSGIELFKHSGSTKNFNLEELRKRHIADIRRYRLYGARNEIPVKTLGRSIEDREIRKSLANELKEVRKKKVNIEH